MYTKKERNEYNEQRERICQRLGITKNQYNWLRRKGEELRKVYENDCNGDYKTEAESNLAENRVKMAIWQYRLKNKNIKQLKMFYQTDCRGATIYLDNKPISDNAYTNASCIY